MSRPRKVLSSSAYMENIPRVQPRAAAALLAGDSQGFREEDDKVGLIVRRIREIFGTTGHWSG